MIRIRIPCCVIMATALTCIAGSLSAQAPARVGSEFIPLDATATALVSVADSMTGPGMELYPTEIADAWCEQNIGIRASDIDSVKVVVGAPGPAGPMYAAVLRLRSDLNVQNINPNLLVPQAEDVDGFSAYPLAPDPNTVLHQLDSKTAIIASRNYLGPVVRAAEGNSGGPLAKLAAAVPHVGNLTLVVAIEPIRPMVNGFVQMQADQIPPPLQDFTKIPNLLDALLLRVNLADQENGLALVMLSPDESSATELSGILQRGLEMARQMIVAQMMAEVQGDDPVAEATRQYIQRVSGSIVAMITPRQNGRRLSISGSPTQGFAVQGVLVGLLLPAVQSAREAARRMESSNNLKQLALAFHNYHDVHGHFPTDIRNSDGTPLLSWRVAVLPFLEESALYEQFHLDEPWDSPHNITLIGQMPNVLSDPRAPTPPGLTVYQRPKGDAFLNHPSKTFRLRDITDGTSNTIMIVEASPMQAVEWTKPDDLTLDRSDPVDGLTDGRPNGFNVALADGAVIFISDSVDPEVFWALLTPNGGEVVPR